MAPVDLLDAATRPPNSILNLEKSTETWHAQIAKATSILGLDLDEAWRYTLQNTETCLLTSDIVVDPRVDWALRWLLKKLDPSGSQLSEESKTYKSWLLLRELIARCPTATVARLLRAHHFVTTAETTLLFMRDVTAQNLEGSNDVDEDQVQTTSTEATSRKRKRPGSDSPPAKVSTQISNLGALFIAFCGALGQVMALTKQSTVGSQDYAIEHMRYAMKPLPESAANILGSGLYVVNDLIQDPKLSSRLTSTELLSLHREMEKTAYQSALNPLVELWDLQSSRSQDSSTYMKHRAYMTICTVPSLQLLQTCKEWVYQEKDVEPVTKILERLLTDHVINPTRNASLPGTGQTGSNGFEVYPPLSDDLIRALKARPLAHRLLGNRADMKTKDHMQLSLLSLLFSLAVNCRPRYTPKLRQIEDTWLEKLFFQLDTVGAPDQRPVPLSNARKSHRRLLRWLLQNAVDASVSFSVSALEQVLENASGLFENHANQQLDWTIISLCLSIDADVFVIPGNQAQASSNRFTRPPNKNLKALLEAVTHYQASEIKERHSIISTTLTPLVSGFAQARDLPGFIGHWGEQLDVVQHKQTNESGQDSIWEDDALRLEVSSRVDALAPSQILDLLSDFLNGPEASISQSFKYGPISLRQIMICDVIFGGINREENIDKITHQAESSFVFVVECLRKPGTEFSRYAWRLWRILTIIIDRWSLRRVYRNINHAIPSAIRQAWTLLKEIPLWDPDSRETQCDFTEHYQAFQFMLSCCSVGGAFEKLFGSLRKAEKAIQRLLDIMHPLCQRIEYDIWGNFQCSKHDRASFMPGARITSLESLYLACVSCLLSNPGVLSSVREQIQSRLIEQVYHCALFHRRSSLALESGFIDYAWPWQQLVRLMILIKSTQTHECMNAFQIRTYLKASQFQDPKHWDIKSADYDLAFESLNTVSINDLSSGKRKVVANRVLCILTTSSMGSIACMTAHLVALQKLIKHPSKSMCILSNLSIPCKDELAPKPRGRVALLEIAGRIDEGLAWSVETIDCIDVFEKLAQAVIKYLFSTLDREESINYLRALYGSLAAQLESGYGVKTNSSAFSVVTCVTLAAFHEHLDSFPKIFRDHTFPLQTTRQYHLESLLLRVRRILNIPHDSLIKCKEWAKSHHDLGIDLACMVGYIDLLRIHPDLAGEDGILSRLQDLSTALGQRPCRCMGPDDEDYNGLGGPEHVAIRLAQLEMSLSHSDDGLIPYLIEQSRLFDSDVVIKTPSDPPISETPKSLPICSPKAKGITLHSIQDAVSTLSSAQKAELLTSLIHSNAGSTLGNGKLYLIRAIILSISDEEEEELRSALSKACTFLYRGLAQDTDSRPALISMQCISAFLRRQARSVTQWHIDNFLSTISIFSRRIQTQRAEEQSGRLYTGLCRLLATVLRIHRAKIGGRYHLVLPALQGLLGCLFTPYARYDGSREPEVFTEAHAVEYARILTMICDPTVSAVTRSKKRSRIELNDETKKARSIAGQYLQYLIMEYCGYQLKGRISPEIRSALNVGLWAILEVVSKDVMRTMNAAMDQDRRSVFKALYDDFRKFGKWQGG